MPSRCPSHWFLGPLAAGLILFLVSTGRCQSPRPDGGEGLDLADPATSATLTVRRAEKLKTILCAKRDIIEKAVPPSVQMGLADFLAQQLGERFHRRSAWAGRSPDYQPIIRGSRVWEPIGKIEFLTIHHAEGVPDEHPAAMIRNIFRGHTGGGASFIAADVGYHFFVDRDGEVWEGRNAAHKGTHVGSNPWGENNEGNLGICGLGTFLHESPPRAMSKGFVELTGLIQRYYGRPLTVRGHKDWVGINGFHPRGGCDCPGRLEKTVYEVRKALKDQPTLAASAEASGQALPSPGPRPEGQSIARP